MEFVKFKDVEFEKAVRASLEKLDEGLNNIDLIGIQGLSISDQDTNSIQIPWQNNSAISNMTLPKVRFNINNSKNGKWIEDLKLFKHIKSLHLYVAIDDLSFLNEFIALNELYIIESNDTDWSFIKNMGYLQCLLVNNSSFFDINSIGILNIKQLEIYEKSESEIENTEKQFKIFNGLKNLNLCNCNISDISSLSKCINLIDVNLSQNKISDLSPLSNLSRLYYLTLRYNNIIDINPLQRLRGLYYLNLSHNHISDISIFNDFEYMRNIRRLFLKYNNITDYNPVYNLNLLANDIFDGIRLYSKNSRKKDRSKFKKLKNIMIT